MSRNCEGRGWRERYICVRAFPNRGNSSSSGVRGNVLKIGNKSRKKFKKAKSKVGDERF